MIQESPAEREEGCVIVTGAARGIGAAIAQAFVTSGRRVVVTDIFDEGAQVAEVLDGEGPGQAAFIRADVRDVHSIGPLMDDAVSEFGNIDGVINNAAVTRPIEFFDISADDWNQVLEVNARGYFFVMQGAARRMKDSGGGVIVNVASIAGKGWRHTSNVAYAASKGAVIAMTRIAAASLGQYGIRVNAVAPGMTMTDMWRTWLEGRAAEERLSSAELLAELTADVPTGQLNTPDDVAQAALFLCSPQARNITGQSLNIDGGTVWD